MSAEQKWDVFICHASEDKDDVARPLANTLTQAGLEVWYDDDELVIGDKVHRSIDNAIGKSNFGVVVYSPSFQSKAWPQQELDALRARENAGELTILPIVHQATQAEFAQHFTLLAGRKILSTADGLDFVAQQVLAAVRRGQSIERDQATPVAVQPAAEISAELRKAAEEGLEGVMRTLLERGIDANNQDASGTTILMLAAAAGQESIVRLLLVYEAAVDTGDDEGATALMMAAKAGHSHVVELLLDRGAQIDATDHERSTPLTYAASAGRDDVIVLLLGRGASVGSAAGARMPPLSFVARDGSGEIVRLLLDNGAQIDAQGGDEYRSALWWSAEQGHVDIVETLLARGANPDLQDLTGATALHAAARGNHDEIAAALIRAAATIDFCDETDSTALIEAARHGSRDVVATLLAAGAAIGATDKAGDTVLTHAARTPKHEVVDLLLQHGAQPQIRDFAATAKEDWSARKEPQPVQTSLLRTIADDATRSAIACALRKLYGEHVVQALSALLGEGPPNPEFYFDDYDQSTHYLTDAIAWAHADTIRVLIARGADPNGYLQDAAACGLVEGISILLDVGVSPKLKDRYNRTALFCAVGEGCAEVVRLLLSRGAEVDTTAGPERTPLMVAAAVGNEELVGILLEAGADRNRKDTDGKTAADFARHPKDGTRWVRLFGHRGVLGLLRRAR